jgi:hypothetical protein
MKTEHDSGKILANWLLRTPGGSQNPKPPYQTWWLRPKHVPVTQSVMHSIIQDQSKLCGKMAGILRF